MLVLDGNVGADFVAQSQTGESHFGIGSGGGIGVIRGVGVGQHEVVRLLQMLVASLMGSLLGRTRGTQ